MERVDMAGDPAGTGSMRPTLAENIASELRARLGSGDLKPGDRLPTEQELGRIYGVSRTVVREAIAALRSDGRVVARQGSGVFVAEWRRPPELSLLSMEPVKISSIIEILELRSAVESEAAGLAAERRSPAEFAKIRERHDAFSEAIASDQQAESQDFAFHLAIAESTHNQHFVEFFRFLGAHTIPRAQARSRATVQQPTTDGMRAYLARLLDEHREIVDAISAKDAGAAHAAMHRHLKGSQERYERLADARR